MSEAKLQEKDILQALGEVDEPELGKDLVTLGMIRDIRICGGMVSFQVVLATPVCPYKDELRDACEAAVRALPGVERVEIGWGAEVKRGLLRDKKPIGAIKNIIAVASGKGGVGKSTVAVNLAVALHVSGAQVGLMDADIYGPSIPLMMGVHQQPLIVGDKIQPLVGYGLRLMSLGFVADGDAPVIWRGPMVMKAVTQFLEEVDWGELDYLVIDLPPGTGDAQLTLVQRVPVSGAVIVTTPQDVALLDARKGLRMFQEVNAPVLGIVENMSYFICPHCGKETDIFSRGGGRRTAEELGVPFLGEIPLDASIRESGDRGKPIVLAEPDSTITAAFKAVAAQAAVELSVLAASAPPEIKWFARMT